MKGVTKVEIKKFEERVILELNKALGQPHSCYVNPDGTRHIEWSFERSDGDINISLFTKQERNGRIYRSRNVFFRLRDHKYERGKMPYGFSESGKNNLHISNDLSHEESIAAFATHLNGIAERDSLEFEAFGNISWEV